MSTDSSVSTATQPAEQKASWAPLIGLFLGQVLMSFNVSALPVSLGGIVDEFGVPATLASTTIVAYGLFVAALVMVGANHGQTFGLARINSEVVYTIAVSSMNMIF